ncbi:hypothetical protein ACN47E_001232 [Coniothyrium glycines]
MGGRESVGKCRALRLLYTVPERFNEFAHMDQRTFFELSDWILANVPSQTSADISVEESLFVFLDIVAQGSSFSEVAYGWDHDIQLTQSIFLNVLSALTVLRESIQIADSCPPFKQTRRRWSVTKSWNPRRPSTGRVKIGYDEMSNDGLEIDQDTLKEALTALNNFIHEQADCDA